MEIIKGKDLLGKVILSDETGKKLGIVEDLEFVTESGELLNMIVKDPTKYLKERGVKVDEKGRFLIPFTAVKSVGDFVVVSERELI